MTDLLIPKPCHENWDAMSPRDDGRHCATCAKTVVDLTVFDAEDGARVLARIHAQVSAHAHICVRAPADAGGRIVLPARAVAVPHSRPRQTRGRRLLTNGLAAVLAMVVAGDLASAADSGNAPSATAPISAGPPDITRTPDPDGQDGTPVIRTPVEVAPPVTVMQGDAAVPDPQPQPKPSATTGAVVPLPHMVVSGTVALPRVTGQVRVQEPQGDQNAQDATPAPVRMGEPQVKRSSTGAADF
jgi:hypothetical protein